MIFRYRNISWDFHSSDDNRDLIAKTKEVYGVDLSDIESAKLWQIFGSHRCKPDLVTWR